MAAAGGRQLWQLVIDDKPLTKEFLDQALSAGESPSGGSAPAPSGSGSASPGGAPAAPDPADGLPDDERAAAGLCS